MKFGRKNILRYANTDVNQKVTHNLNDTLSAKLRKWKNGRTSFKDDEDKYNIFMQNKIQKIREGFSNTNRDQEEQNKIIQYIQQIQSIEKELYEKLKSNPSMSQQDRNRIINNIGKISNMKIDMYKNMKNTYSYVKNDSNTISAVMQDQKHAIDIVEKELSLAQQELEAVEKENIEINRSTEINTYFKKKYNNQREFYTILFFTGLSIAILLLLAKMNMVGGNIFNGIFVAIISVSIYYSWDIVYKLMTRDTMDYDKNDWTFNTNDAPLSSNVMPTNDPWKVSSITCSGQDCCDGTDIYDSDKNKCVQLN